MTREHGMTFREDMAAAIRNKFKWQTRRLMDPQPPQWADGREIRHIKDDLWGLFAVHGNAAACRSEDTIRCPWRAGDRIYVQEDWWLHKSEFIEQAGFPGGTIVLLKDGTLSRFDENKSFDPRHYAIWKRQEPRDMPSWAARTWLEITEIKVQRIQDISEEDARAEYARGPEPAVVGGELCEIGPPTYRHGFREIWNSLYPGSWERNDWVWVLTSKPLKAKGRAA